MRIREVFRWVALSTIFGELAFLSNQSLPGRIRVPVPPPSEGIYRRADLELEFCRDPLPSRIVSAYQEAVRVHIAGKPLEALGRYLGLVFVDRDGSQVALAQQSAVVAYNVHIAYEAAGRSYMKEADAYLELYNKLLDEATG